MLDMTAEPEQASLLHRQLAAMPAQGRQPRLSRSLMPMLTDIATGLLRSLDMSPRLSAWQLLPQMAALCAVSPGLLQDVSGCLYPLCAVRHGLSVSCVERRLRLAVESTWSRSDLDALDRLFGQTVDPMRGKPTNREFLARLAVCIAQEAAQRERPYTAAAPLAYDGDLSIG